MAEQNKSIKIPEEKQATISNTVTHSFPFISFSFNMAQYGTIRQVSVMEIQAAYTARLKWLNQSEK